MLDSTPQQPQGLLTPKQAEAARVIGQHPNSCLWGGSRSGKTFLICRALILRALAAPGSRHAMFRHAFNHIRRSIGLDTMPKVAELHFPNHRIHLNKTDWFFEVGDFGSQIWLGGLDDKDRTEKILGQEFASLIVNESSQVSYESVLMAQTRLAQRVEVAPEFGGGLLPLKFVCDLNPTNKKHWSHKLFVEKVEPTGGLSLPNPDHYGGLQMNPVDNLQNLPPDYLDRLAAMPRRQRERFLAGNWQDDVEGALWKRSMIRYTDQVPDLVRIVVAVDPSGSKNGDEVGIVVAGIDEDGLIYILDDRSGQYSPAQWGSKTVEAYDDWDADRIIGERNYGGDMVGNNVANAATEMFRQGKIDSPHPAYADVNASRGKAIRAEPIAGLYETGRVVHADEFPELEDQLCSFKADFDRRTDKSPDRLDAMVFAVTELTTGGLRPASVGFWGGD